jgi:hypothetical protein
MYKLLMLLSCAALGCSADTEPSSSRAPVGQPVGAVCSPDNLTQACRCDNGLSGRQSCTGSSWSVCSCRPVAGAAAGSAAPGAANTAIGADGDPVANRSSTRFDWQRTVPTGGSCEAGHYEGTFTGIYGPSIIVVADLKVIPVFPIDLPGMPGLAFDLTREGSGEVFTVSNGKLIGNALGAFPLMADIEGKLNCDTLKFDAKLVRGQYAIGPLPFNFEGPITADYDKLTHTFVNGVWMVTEPDYPSAGGSGDWTVHWLHN